MFGTLCKLLAFLVTVISSEGKPSNQPVIGIVLEVSIPHMPIAKNVYWAMADYKSYIEQAGGGAVPLFINQPDEYYEKLIPRLNGVLLPGGGSDLVTSPYAKVANKVFQMAMKMNDAGIHFPVWGTCLGMQEMTTWPLNPRKDILSNCSDTEGISLPLNFTAQVKTSKLYSRAPPFILDILSKEKVTPNFHSYCLTTDTYGSNSALNKFYTVTSTNKDSKGMEFVSSLESRTYPFFGIQWHPEKINFMHSPGTEKALDNSLNGVLVSQFCANFFIEEARQNNNSFKSVSEEGRFLFNRYHSSYHNMFEMYTFTDLDVPRFE